jgi:hypothetical protein
MSPLSRRIVPSWVAADIIRASLFTCVQKREKKA